MERDKFLLMCVGVKIGPLFSSPPSPVPSDKRIAHDLDLVYNAQGLFTHTRHQVTDSLIEALKFEPTEVVNHQYRANNSDQVREISGSPEYS